MSSISGRFLSITSSSVRRAAAMHGRAAFLFPLARIVPLIGNPPFDSIFVHYDSPQSLASSIRVLTIFVIWFSEAHSVLE